MIQDIELTTPKMTGKGFEKYITSLVVGAGYEELPLRGPHKATMFSDRDSISGPVVCREVGLGANEWTDNRVVDMLVINKEVFPNDLVIEVKWQSSPGSIDEKLKGLVKVDIAEGGVPTILVLDGGGCRERTYNTLKSLVGKVPNFVGMYTSLEFESAIYNGLLTKKNVTVNS